MVKYCTICNKIIYGRARKYCQECKKKEHLEQMHKYYIKNTSRWQYNGKYWNRRRGVQLCGTGGLGPKSTLNWDEEQKKIEKELINLKLRKPTK
jgi:hypothetical protein